MESDARDALVHLNETERGCVLKYLFLSGHLTEGALQEVWLFGSAARGDMWPDGSPMHSDIDLLVLTDQPLSSEIQRSLIEKTYPLFSECGRQISPQFRTLAQFYEPANEKANNFGQGVQREGKLLYKNKPPSTQ